VLEEKGGKEGESVRRIRGGEKTNGGGGEAEGVPLFYIDAVVVQGWEELGGMVGLESVELCGEERGIKGRGVFFRQG